MAVPTAAARAGPSHADVRWQRTAAWGMALAGVLMVALALRGPHLQDVPHLTDETTEVVWAHAIAFDGMRPLAHADSYDGPLWPYLLAAALRLSGSSARLPREFALALALASVAATFGLGAQLADPRRRLVAATVAGLALAATFSHALVNSRVAWSNGSTPLWTTLAAVALVAAARRPSAGRFVLAGFAAGLALQSHPSAIVFLAAATVWFALTADRRALFRGPLPWLALAAALVAYSPVIVHNVRTGFATFAEAAASTNTPSGARLGEWVAGVGGLVVQLGRSLSGGYGLDGPDPGWRLVALAYVGLSLGAVTLVAARRDLPAGRRLPAVVLAVSVVALPVFNSNWGGLLESRYLGFLWPLVAACLGVATTEIDATIARSRPYGPGRAVRRLALWLGLATFMAVPGIGVARYDDAATRAGMDNARLWRVLRETRDMSAAGGGVLVDRELKAVRWRAGGHPRRAVEYLLLLDGIPFDRAPLPTINYLVAQGGPYALFLGGPAAEYLSAHYPIAPVDTRARPGEEPWGLYRSPSATPGGE